MVTLMKTAGVTDEDTDEDWGETVASFPITIQNHVVLNVGQVYPFKLGTPTPCSMFVRIRVN